MRSPRSGLPAARSLVVFTPLLLAQGLLAQAQQQPPAPPTRPPFKFLQHEEDWSRFVTPEKDADFLDPIKHMRLNDSGSTWLSLGGRAEARWESWDGFGFGAPTPGNSDDFVLSRLVAHADLHLGEHVRAYLEGITAQSTDRDLPGGRRVTDMDSADIQQGWVEFSTKTDGGDALRLRVGRQAFGFGNQRLVSSLPWANTLNRWEGATGLWSRGPWSVHGLVTWYVPVDKTKNNEVDDDRALYGLYATRAPVDGSPGLDLYLLGDTRPNVTINGSAGDERRHTTGLRTWGTFAERGDWEFEGAYQFGEVGNDDVSAFFATAVAGWKLDVPSLSPRLFTIVDVASGDRSNGGSVQTFHQLYPLGHAHLGFADVVARQNVIAWAVGASLKPTAATTASLTLHTLHLYSTDDAIYSVNGSQFLAGAPAGGFDSGHIGEELDLLVLHKLGLHVDLYAGYSHVFTGSAPEQLGRNDDIDFVYFGTQFTF
jgi:hypothetical protein